MSGEGGEPVLVDVASARAERAASIPGALVFTTTKWPKSFSASDEAVGVVYLARPGEASAAPTLWRRS